MHSRSNVFRALIVFVTTLVFALPASSVHAASWAPVLDLSQDNMGLNVVDSFASNGESTSRIMTLSKDKIQGMPNEYLCNKSFSGNCDPTAHHAEAFEILPPCTTAAQENCIDSISLALDKGTFESAKYLENLGGASLAASPKYGLPAGSTPSLWSSGVSNAGGTNTYEAFVQMHYSWISGGFKPDSLVATLEPYSVTTGDFRPQADTQVTLPNGREAISGDVPNFNCVWTDLGLCGIREDFASGTKVKMSVRLDSRLGGWFKGRLAHPTFNVSHLSSRNNLVTISAEPVDVPQISLNVSKWDASPGIQKFFSSMPGYAGGAVNTRADYDNAFGAIEAFRQYSKDTAQGVIKTWSFGSFGSANNPCLRDSSKLLGLVTTNATVYNGTAPDFVDGQLSYSVSGYHLLPDGSLALGSYDLIMRKSVAKCLYHLTSAAFSATVTVSGEGGNPNFATTEFVQQGIWDRFSAYGFTFSRHRILVKLTQGKNH